MSTTVKLDDFTFAAHELPERINFGGDQRCAVHEMVGGTRIIDAMGRSEDLINWNGLFFGNDALDRARFLDTLRSDGKPLLFTYADFYYKVLIKTFNANMERRNKVPYQLSLYVIENLTDPVRTLPISDFIDAVVQDIQDALDLALLVQNPSISSAIAVLNSIIKVIPSLNGASQTVINSILGPLSKAQATIGSAISALSKTLF